MTMNFQTAYQLNLLCSEFVERQTKNPTSVRVEETPDCLIVFFKKKRLNDQEELEEYEESQTFTWEQFAEYEQNRRNEIIALDALKGQLNRFK